MSRRSSAGAADGRASLRMMRMALSYLAIFVFTLLAVSSAVATNLGGMTPANLRALLFDRPFLHFIGNVALIALAVSITGTAVSSMAGYTLSRFRFLGRSTTLNGLLVSQMLPATMLLFALWLILIALGLINSYLILILIYSATALPFCVWQLKGYYDTIALSLEEAAGIEGCTSWQSFRLVVLPLAMPALAITALFSFLTAWNEYVVAAIVLRDLDGFALPLGLKMSDINAPWGLYAAGALFVSIPVVILFLVLGRFLTASAIGD